MFVVDVSMAVLCILHIKTPSEGVAESWVLLTPSEGVEWCGACRGRRLPEGGDEVADVGVPVLGGGYPAAAGPPMLSISARSASGM